MLHQRGHITLKILLINYEINGGMIMKFLILGAGPAGLSFASELLKNNIDDFLVLERENEAGGLCRSMYIDDAPLDIGGGHFIDIKRKRVLDLLFSVMPGRMETLSEKFTD